MSACTVRFVVLLLENPVRSYAWGSPTVLPELLGSKPTGQPQAELWVGAHPGAPSIVVDDGRPLGQHIADDPEASLGRGVVSRFGPTLPFLLKVLAVERPLSIQVHPNLAQAQIGFAGENAAGVPLDAPHRRYRDPNHKPEMVVALTDFEALLGFRRPGDAAEVVGTLGLAELDGAAADLAGGGLESVAREWMTMPSAEASDLAKRVGEAAAQHDGLEVIARLAGHDPGDRGILLALLLNHVQLRPGEAAFTGPGVPHCYLSGVAVEPQASSDNTLRAGLTPKHVDTEEVLRLLRFEPDGGQLVQPVQDEQRATWVIAGVEEFQLSRITGDADIGGPGPSVVLVVDGSFAVTGSRPDRPLSRGAAAFVPASDQGATLRGVGEAFAVTTAVSRAG